MAAAELSGSTLALGFILTMTLLDEASLSHVYAYSTVTDLGLRVRGNPDFKVD